MSYNNIGEACELLYISTYMMCKKHINNIYFYYYNFF